MEETINERVLKRIILNKGIFSIAEIKLIRENKETISKIYFLGATDASYKRITNRNIK